jgi:16S rRNA (uracil1498-N3)-methyltransferase
MQVHALPAGMLTGSTLRLEGDEARHIVKVLRKRVGDEVVFTDGHGSFIHAQLDRVQSSRIHARVLRREDDPRERSAPWSNLGLAVLKGDHFELALEKVVELGVHRIIPILAERCVVQLDGEKKKRRLERWGRIAESAMKQAGRSWRPLIEEPLDVEGVLERFAGETRIIVADEELSEPRSQELAWPFGRSYLALVGPEGAFSPREKEMIRSRGAWATSLSPYRLRSETAAIVLLAALNGGERVV